MRIKLLTLLLLCLVLTSCSSGAELCPLDDYSVRYNENAEDFGFKKISLSTSDSGVCGFAAFDGLFIVCLCVTEEGYIYSADISTGSEYSKLISQDETEFEKALLSAAYLVSPLYLEEPSEEDISKIAGMILAALKEAKTVTPQKGMSISGKMTSNGGFEFEVNLV